MGTFTVIPENTFNELQMDAGVLLRTFNPASPAVTDSAIICATTGGIQATCEPEFSDLGEDVDNCPNNMKELKHLDSWNCTLAFTALGTSPASIKMSLGCADIDGTDETKIIPRADLAQTDFSDVWWVGDRADGGCVAIQLKNALSTSGFSLQTTKSGKGQVSVTLTGHVSLTAQKVVPMVFYSLDPEDVAAYKVETVLSNVTSSFEGNSVAAEGEFETTLTAATGATFANVVVLMGGVDVTSDAYNSSTHKVSISSVTGNIQIIATATTA